MIQAHPAYDDTQHTWGVGVTPPASGSGGTSRALTGTDARWLLSLNPLPVQPGDYDFTQVTARVGNTQTSGTPTNCDKAYVAVYAKVANGGNTFFRLRGFAEIPLASLPGSGLGNITYPSTPAKMFSVQAATGDQLYWALALHGPLNHANNQPSIIHQAASIGPDESYVYSATNAPIDPRLPVELDAALADFSPGSGNGVHILGRLTFKTTTRKVFALVGSDTVKVYKASDPNQPVRTIIPFRTDGPCWIVLRATKTVNLKNLACQLSLGGATTETEIDTLTIDMNAKNVAYKETTNTRTVPLVDGEQGQTIDFAIVLRQDAGTTKSNVLWVNRTFGRGPASSIADIMTRSHRTYYQANKVPPSSTPREDGRDGYAAVSNGTPEYLKLSSSDTTADTHIETIEVCDRLCVLFGDSNVGNLTSTSAISRPVRLGEFFPNALETPLAWWIGGISNNELAGPSGMAPGTQTLGYLRYCHATPGLGDLCDMRSVLLMVSIGGNDLQNTEPTEAQRNRWIGDMAGRLDTLFSQLFTGDNALDNRATVFGMPPLIALSGSGTQSEILRQSMVQWSDSLLGVCAAWRVPFYNPYYLAINKDGYISSSVVAHYSDTGAAAICAAAAIAYQTNRIAGAGMGIY